MAIAEPAAAAPPERRLPPVRIRLDLPVAKQHFDFRVQAAVVIAAVPKEANSSGYATIATGRTSELIEMWARLTKTLMDCRLERQMVTQLAKERKR